MKADSKTIWKWLAVVELILATAVIRFDLFLPTLIMVAMAVVSLLLRRESVATLGLKRPPPWLRLAGFAFLSAVLLQLFDVAVTMPILNRLTGTTIVYSGFDHLKGNLGQMLLLLILSWTLAAFGEEFVYRGYLQKRLTDLFGANLLGICLTVGISSVLFGLAHLEQGLIGVVITTTDALVFSWLKRKFNNNLWVTVLAHGFYNSVGVLAFYLIGPIYGLW